MKKLKCKIFGHKYKIIKEFTHGQRCVSCDRCNRIWAMHDGVKAFVEWDGDFTELYNWSPFSNKV